MKKIITYVTFVFVLMGCNKENANDCIQSSGAIIRQEVTVEPFTKIRVNRDVELILKEGTPQKVEIETGKNLIKDVVAEVTNGKLILSNNNTCNLVRDYNVTKVYVTAPNITYIKSSTQFKIRSVGVLNYDNLSIVSENFNDPTTLAVGTVILHVNAQTIEVVANNITHFVLLGTTENLKLFQASGDGVIDAGELVADVVRVFHRGSNKMIVNPQQKLTGILRGTGNLIVKNHPPIVNVVQYYTGVLLYE